MSIVSGSSLIGRVLHEGATKDQNEAVIFGERKGRENMCFCETNRIGNLVIFNTSITLITSYDDGAKFFNPVRFSENRLSKGEGQQGDFSLTRWETSPSIEP